MMLSSLPRLVLHVHHHLSSNIYKMPTMCIRGGIGNRGRVREHFCSALSNIHIRCVVDAVVCHLQPSCRTKALTPEVVKNVGCWQPPGYLPGSYPPSFKGCCLAQGYMPCPRLYAAHILSLWVGSKAQPPYLNSGQLWRATPVPELPVGSAKSCPNYYISAQPLPLPNPVSLIRSLPGAPESPPPHTSMPHSGTINFLYANLCLLRQVQDPSFCLVEDDGWVQGWLLGPQQAGMGRAQLNRLGTVFLRRTLYIRYCVSLELHNELWTGEGPFSIKITSFSFSSRIMVAKVLS